MKLPINYFENLTATKYREYLKLLPNIHSDNTALITTLILTFAALSFFGIVAINPTLSTIVELKKQLSDTNFVNEQLDKKIMNLSSLQEKYTNLTPDIPVIFSAIPDNASAPLLSAQIEAVAEKNKIHIMSFRIFEVQMSGDKQDSISGSSYVFSLSANGNYEDMLSFASAISRINRIITLESISISRDTAKNQLVLDLRGRQYFLR